MRNNGAPSWIVTFADLMALMMTFFVLLYSFSIIDEKKYKGIVESMSDSFGGKNLINFGSPTQGQIPSSNNIASIKSKQTEISHQYHPHEDELNDTINKEAIQLLETFLQVLNVEIDKKMVEVKITDASVVVTFPERITFESGSDQLNASFMSVLHKVTQVLNDVPGYIVIAGHTDDLPINTDRFRSNWDLSTARAVSMAHAILQDSRIDSGHLVVVGHGSSHPLLPNDTLQHRAKNRRVEISIINENEALPHFIKH